MHAAAYDKNKKLFATKKWFLFVCDRRASALKKGSLTEAIGLSGFAEWTLGSSNSYTSIAVLQITMHARHYSLIVPLKIFLNLINLEY